MYVVYKQWEVAPFSNGIFNKDGLVIKALISLLVSVIFLINLHFLTI